MTAKQENMTNRTIEEKIRQKDKTAILELRNRTLELCYKYLKGGDVRSKDMEDLVQEGIYRLYLKLQRDLEFLIPTAAERYVFGIVRNIWRDELKQHKKEQTYYNLDDDQNRIKDSISEESEAIDLELSVEGEHAVIPLLDQLGKDCKTVLLAFYVYKNSLAEIAEELAQSVQYIKLKRFRCMKSLRALYLQN